MTAFRIAFSALFVLVLLPAWWFFAPIGPGKHEAQELVGRQNVGVVIQDWLGCSRRLTGEALCSFKVNPQILAAATGEPPEQASGETKNPTIARFVNDHGWVLVGFEP